MKSMGFFDRLSLRALLAGAGAVSAAMLAAALVAQYGFGLHPCDLCMYQRYPYAAIIALALLGAVMPRGRWALALLCALLFALDAGIAFYHTGVEIGWFTGPEACSNSGGAGQTLEDMRRQLLEAPLVSCSQAMAYIFGLSMAAWNALAAGCFAFVMFFGVWRKQ